MINNLKGKKLLVLGGKPVASYEIVEYAKSKGVYTIVTDFLSKQKSRAKQIADECWDISTADIETLIPLIENNKIDGVFTGVHEFNILKCLDICERLNLPFYSNRIQWEQTTNKALFKEICKKYNIPVVKDYYFAGNQETSLGYPVIVKPIDGSSGKGISICNNAKELKIAYLHAMSVSSKRSVLVEEYITGDEIVVFYSIKNGTVKLSVITDYYYNYDQKITMPLPQVYIYPSIYLEKYFEEMNDKVIEMIKGLKILNGTFFLQAFANENGFTFFEPGFRLGGSSVYKYTSHLNSISSLEMLVNYALTGDMGDVDLNLENPKFSKPCCTLSLVSKGGTVGQILGYDTASMLKGVIDSELRYNEGEHIHLNSALGQIHLRFFIVGENFTEIVNIIKKIQENVKVFDQKGESMLIKSFDVKRLFKYF